MTLTINAAIEPGTRRNLAPLFEPRHIAVIGASRTPGKHGNTVVRNLLNWGYGGRIFPVNPSGEAIEGLTCYRSIGDTPEPADCAFLVIPASACVDAVRQCAAAGVRSLVIAATGFAETGTEKGRLRQAEITAIAREHGIRILGPNTNGFLNAASGVSLGYNTSHAEVAAAGSIAVASHSGALFNAIARRLSAANTHLGKFISIGNEADIDLLDVFDYLIEDDATRVIGLLIEGLSDGARFRRLAQRARDRGKPVIALKLGRSAAGASSSQAHSSRLAGKARAYDALFKSCGVAVVQSLEALTGGCSLLTRYHPARATGHQGLICVATSGAGGTLCADFAGARDIPLAGQADGAWPEAINAALAAAIPELGPLRNPIDTSGLRGDRSRLLPVLQTLRAQGYGGPVAVFSHVAARQHQDEKMARALSTWQRENPAPIILMAPGRLPADIEELYAQGGIPLFHDMAGGFDSLACYYATLPATDRDATAIVVPENDLAAPVAEAIEPILQRVADQAVLSEFDSSEILRLAGIPMVECRTVLAASEAVRAADQIGYPVVLKALPLGIAHKDKLGLVRTNLIDAGAVTDSFAALELLLAQQGSARGTAPMIVQPMVASRIELLAGISTEPPLGQFLVFGLGGVHTDLLDRVELLPIPTDTTTIHAAVSASLTGRILAARGDGDQSLRQFVAILDRLQRLAIRFDNALDSIDINPILLSKTGCIGVDALIVTSQKPPTNP